MRLGRITTRWSRAGYRAGLASESGIEACLVRGRSGHIRAAAQPQAVMWQNRQV
jgi:hypothetical protein